MNTQKVKLTRIYTSNKDKSGNPLMSKAGKPYTRMSIKTEQYGDKWISGFQNASNKNWKDGDEVEVIISKKGEYLNFETPKQEDKVIMMLSQVLTMLGGIELKFELLAEKLYPKGSGSSNGSFDYPVEDINSDDIPF